jgi:hypothetical protein
MNTPTSQLITRWRNKRQPADLKGPNKSLPHEWVWEIEAEVPAEVWEMVANINMDARYQLMCTCKFLYRLLRVRYRPPPPLPSAQNVLRWLRWLRCRRYLCWCCMKVVQVSDRAAWWKDMKGVLLCRKCYHDQVKSKDIVLYNSSGGYQQYCSVVFPHTVVTKPLLL